ncbi:hypothetical protein Vadar_034707 [Vaccinium darrowii]|uniref:Uncharacterized protein n=1 Tax=Vaccinium darrowii TaxID=229202 RepID=A0ACB7XFD8_9ERIC|nr:hypothetical protein Vadar_034707 [Vaccinium darrowii]
MLRFLSKSKLLTQIKIALDSPTQICSSHISLLSLSSNSSFSVSSVGGSSNSNIRPSTKQNPSFTVKNLINSGGSSHESCIPSESLEKPNSVIRLFEDSGFSQTQIRTIVSKRPVLLLYNASLLKPKLDFLHSIGMSEADVVNMVTKDPFILYRSLKNHLIPSFGLLRTLLGGERNVVNALKSHPSIIRYDVAKRLAPNVETLRIMGVPESQVSRMVTRFTCSRALASMQPQWFRNVVSTLIGMGFSPSSKSFERAVYAMGGRNELGWEGKLKFYGSLGFSNKEVFFMFKKQSIAMCLSNKKIRAAVEFFCNKFHWGLPQLARRPNVLLYSLEKRTIPRCAVLQVLVSRNKIRANVKVLTFLPMTEINFLGKYVNKYKDELSEVWDAYQGKLEFDEYTFRLE